MGAVEIYEVRSKSDPNKTYRVKKENGDWSCNCLYFLMKERLIKKGLLKECKHVKEKKEELQYDE